MSSFPGGPVNSFQCIHGEHAADQALRRLRLELADVLRGSFNAEPSSCTSSRGDRYFYETNVSLNHGDDSLHSDVSARGCEADGDVFVTAVSYPHETWDVRAGGHISFASRDTCEELDAARCAELLRQRGVDTDGMYFPFLPMEMDGMHHHGVEIQRDLSVPPAPGRTVLFDATLAHRVFPWDRTLQPTRLANVMHVRCARQQQS